MRLRVKLKSAMQNERRKERDRDGHHDDERVSEVVEEKEHDEADEQDREDNVPNDVIRRFDREDGRIFRDLELEALRAVVALKAIELEMYLLAHLDGVRPRTA